MYNSQVSILNSQFSTLNSQLRVETLASSSWFGLLVLGILIALVLSISAHRKQYTLYVRNLLNKQGRVMNYETESTSLWVNVLLWLVIISVYALVMNVCIAFLDFRGQFVRFSIPIFFVIFTSVGVYFVLKWMLFRFLGYVFDCREVAQAFSVDYFVIVAMFGVVLLPMVLGMIYTLGKFDLIWLFAMLFVAVVMIITLFIKLLQIFYSGISSLFYIFLYLCTSEFLPLLVAAKVASIVVNIV